MAPEHAAEVLKTMMIGMHYCRTEVEALETAILYLERAAEEDDMK